MKKVSQETTAGEDCPLPESTPPTPRLAVLDFATLPKANAYCGVTLADWEWPFEPASVSTDFKAALGEAFLEVVSAPMHRLGSDWRLPEVLGRSHSRTGDPALLPGSPFAQIRSCITAIEYEVHAVHKGLSARALMCFWQSVGMAEEIERLAAAIVPEDGFGVDHVAGYARRAISLYCVAALGDEATDSGDERPSRQMIEQAIDDGRYRDAADLCRKRRGISKANIERKAGYTPESKMFAAFQRGTYKPGSTPYNNFVRELLAD